MISVYDNALSSPLTLAETRKMGEFISAASAVANLMQYIGMDAMIEGAEIEDLGKLLKALLSYPMEASDQILSEKRKAEKGDES